MLKKETKVKETAIYDSQECNYVFREVSKQQILEISAEGLSDFSSDISKLFAEEMKGQPPKQADLPTQYNAYDRARKCIRPALYGICAIGFALAKLGFALAWFSDTSFGQFIFDLFI